MGNFLNTAFGSYVKSFLVIILAYIVSKGDIFQIDWKDLFNTAIMAILPVVINYLNPKDVRYGKNKE